MHVRLGAHRKPAPFRPPALMKYGIISALLVSFAVLVSVVLPADTVQERLAQHINLGKAFYENPGASRQAVEEFRQAMALAPNSAREHLNYGLALLRAGRTSEGAAELEKARSLNPSLPHTYFNLGVVYKKEGDFTRALREFEQMARLVPDEAVTHYNLGTLYKLQGQNEKAISEFETAARLDPALAAPHFQLFNAYRLAHNTEQAQRELAAFQEIKNKQSAEGASEDMDWSYYSEILDDIHSGGASSEPAQPAEVVFQDQLLGTIAGRDPGIAALDADGDGRLDLLAWSADRVVLFRNTGKGFSAFPVEGARGPAFAGDFNNDGLPDLCILNPPGAELWTNRKGSFARTAKLPPAGSFRKALWVDFDHDYDLDLLLMGEQQALLRNNGDGSWSDVSGQFPFAAGQALDAVALELEPNGNTFDIVAAYRNRPAVLYRDRKAGRYEATPLAFPLEGALETGDFNQDGSLDVAAVGSARLAFIENRGGNLVRRPDVPLAAGAGALFADFQNRGRVDVLGDRRMLLSNGEFTYQNGNVRGTTGGWLAAVAGDFNNDGLTDAAVIRDGGSVHLLLNLTPKKNNWLKVALTGVKNLKLASGARVEVKAGGLYEKQVYQGVPLVFGLGGYTFADTVRITWPNGLVQNEIRQKAGMSYTFKEAPRLSGSCPMIFTWNGRRFEFISDVLGVAPMGAGLAEGEVFPLDHDEYVQIPGRALQPRGGLYDVRVTEELHEVSYLDQIQLVAVDHPAGIEIFTNEKFKSPPFPDFRLFGVKRRMYPSAARDDHGRDVRELILRRDARYPDGFRRDLNGRAEIHSLTLDFPNLPAHPVLFLHGWVDWADGSTFVAASQSRAGSLVIPYLQVKDAGGNWRTVIEDMGMPAGKPKTIAVDLAGKFLSSSREIRIVTNLCVYWDEIFLGDDVFQSGGLDSGPHAESQTPRLTRLAPADADLRFRGFSAVAIDPQRRQPEHFDYAIVEPVSAWNPTPGLYTRYGDVTPLVQAIDDCFVIMGSGDELRLRFSPAALPELRPGWQRDFLLFVDGWAKDADPNTAFGGSVEPLPFHAMRGYPYPRGEHYPDDPLHNEYRRVYNTRQALELIRPLVAQKKRWN